MDSYETSTLYAQQAENANAQELLDKQIAAAKEMNRYNIASQEHINQQNVDTQLKINSILRNDANNAIGIKKRDLINSGYSTANPEFSGNPVATLTSPNRIAPQMQSEFTSDMAQAEIARRRQITDAHLGGLHSLFEGASTNAMVSLSKAQERSANASASGQEIDNDWKDVNYSLSYQQSLEVLSNLKKDGKIKDKEFEKFAYEFSNMDQQFKLMDSQVQLAQIQISQAPERFEKEMSHLSASIAQLNSLASNLNADTSNKYKEGDLLDLKAQLERIRVSYANIGINFDSGGLFDSLARIIMSGKGDLVINNAIDFISSALTGLYDRVVSGIKNNPSPISLGLGALFGSGPLQWSYYAGKNFYRKLWNIFAGSD